MTQHQHPLGLSPQQHAELMDAAKRHAVQLRREAISGAFAGLLNALRQRLASGAAPLRQSPGGVRHGLRPCAD